MHNRPMTRCRVIVVSAMFWMACGQGGTPKPDAGAGDTSGPEAHDVLAAVDEPVAGVPTGDAADARRADAADASFGADGASSPVACAALEPLAKRGVLTERRANQVVFAPDRSWIALKVARPAGSASTEDQVLRIAFPSGEVEPIADSVRSVEALGQRGALLVLGWTDDGPSMTVYDDAGRRGVASGVCSHRATPDGSRVYFIGCSASIVSPLKVLDVATGTVADVADFAVEDRLVISPDSRWAAFVVRDPSAGYMIRVVDAKGSGYSIASQTPAQDPVFATNGLLLFTVNGSGSDPSPEEELRGHVPGSGDTSYHIATGRHLAGSRISPDGSLVLGAASEEDRTDAYLYAIRVDGSGETLVGSDLLSYWRGTRALRVFSFDGGGQWVLYAHAGVGVSVVLATGGVARKLSERGTFQSSPNTGEAILLDDVGNRLGAVLRLVALDSGRDVLSFESEGMLSGVASLPGPSRLVFVEAMPDGSRRLRFISTAWPDSTVLGEWTASSLLSVVGPLTDPHGSYPVDPTGCFTILDTDLDPSPGVSLVLLPG
jgi:hypothetical protein